jgi:hypothetical protein
VLAARGLRGQDEMDRALLALAQARIAGELMGRLRVDDPVGVERWLRDRVVLVGGAVPDGLGVPAVTVAADRAEIPDAAELQRRIARVGEILLLNGLRRVLIVGGRPYAQRLLGRGIDPRIEVRFAPGVRRGKAEAEADVLRTDVVIAWGVDIEPGARDVYATSRAVFVDLPAGDFGNLLEGVVTALTG